MTYRCVYCELTQETQVSYCTFAIGLFKSATYLKSRFSIVSKAPWGTAPAGSCSAAIVFAIPCLVCEMCEKSTKRELVRDKEVALIVLEGRAS